MRTVELVPGIPSSALGFGCAPILGAVDATTARRAIGRALDAGVTHFDLAPSYGYGDAEGFVGRYLAGRRDKVVLATKFGIIATPGARFLRPFKPLVRFLRRWKRGRSEVSAVSARARIGERLHARIAMNPARLRGSVEASLSALRTDYLDYLFLHDPCNPITDIDSLAEEIALLKAEGKIRAWGLAFMREREATHAPVLSRFDVLQFDLSPDVAGYESIRNRRSDCASVLFSPFRGAPIAMPRDVILRRLELDFPRSVILCSMFNPEHIRANVRALERV